MSTPGTFTFATPMRMVDRIHSDASNFRAFSEPSRTSGFTDNNLADVADLSERRHALDGNEANLTGRESDTRVLSFSVDQLRCNASTPDELPTFPGTHLYVMD